MISFWCIPIFCFSNNNAKQPFENYIAKAEFAIANLAYESAELNYQKAIDYCDSKKHLTCFIETSNQLIEHWIITGKYKKAARLLTKNLNSVRKRLPNNTQVKSEIKYLQTLYKYKQGNYKQALEIIAENVQLATAKNYSDSLYLARIFELKGWIQTELSLYNLAFERFNEAYTMHPKKNMLPAVANYHFNIGVYFFKIKDFNNAEKKLIKSLQLRKTIFPARHPLIADCQFWLGKVQIKKEAFKKADSLLKVSLNSRDSLFKNNLHPSIAESYEGLAQMHQQQANYTKAIQHYMISINVLKKIFPNRHPYLGKVYNNLAIVQQTTNEYQDAYKSYTKALSIFKKFYGHQHPYYLNCLKNLGNLNMDAKNMQEARSNFKEAIDLAEKASLSQSLLNQLYYDIAILYSYLDNYNKMNDYLNKVTQITFDQYIQLSKIHFNNKNYADAINFLTRTVTIEENKSFSNQVDLCYWMAQSNYALYKKNEERLYLYKAQKAIQRCDTLIQQRRKAVGELLRFNEMIRPAYELGLQIFNSGYKSTQDSVFIDWAFQFIHTSKAHVLLNRLNENRAIHLGLSPDLIEQEHNYRRTLNRLIKEESQAEFLNKDSIRKLLTNTQHAYKKFKNKLEQEHPQYYQLKYDTTTTTIAQIQAKLNNESSVIEYFLSDESLYILQIEKEDKRFFKISKPEHLFTEIEALRETIYWGISDSISPSQIYEAFVNQATWLYKHVLKPPLDAISSKNIQQLLIIPDNQLNYLPFDLLLTDSLNIKEQNFTNLSYVLKKYAIGYAYSSSFLTNAYPNTNKRYQLNYIGYAPAYESTAKQMVESLKQQTKSAFSLRSGYTNLRYASKAVVKIDSLLDGESYIDEEASKQKFIDNINRAKIQHLAMHGEVDDENPHNSKLIFSDEDLTMDDLNTLQINADLMVLTACKTGDGQLKNGEGVMSLSRAFAYAGCPSVIMSLWSIPDEQTAYLSELFFKNLKNGMSKHLALQQAKLSYLQNPSNDIVDHPFYWGGLVATGNMEPVFKLEQEKQALHWYALLLLFPLLLFIPKLLRLKKIF